MMDKVNVIENIEELEGFLFREYEKAKDDIDTWYFRFHAVSDAIKLLKEQPDIVRCRGCKFGREVCGNIECHKPGMREFESEYHPFEWFCADGKRKKDS